MDVTTGQPLSDVQEIQPVYPVTMILAMAQLLQSGFCLANLGPVGQKVMYTHQRPGGRSGGPVGNDSREVNMIELKVDFLAAIEQSRWREATTLYYRLNRHIPL